MRCSAVGPSNARIAIVGEAPGASEEEKGEPFVGSAGYELASMLADAKLISGSKEELTKVLRNQMYLTNVCMDRPAANKINEFIGIPKKKQTGEEIRHRGKTVKPFVIEECSRLYAELTALKPNLVIALGNIPLWALTKAWGVSKWRGSTLESDVIPGLKVIPAYHPSAVLRNYDWRFITVQDFRRCKRESDYPNIRDPGYIFCTDPEFDKVVGVLTALRLMAEDTSKPLTLVTDVEIKRREILCTGIAWSKREAICIPFYDSKGHRWTPEQHVIIIEKIKELFCHPNVRLCNQNIAFDIQYFFWKHNFWPKVYRDTMVDQNVLFPGLPKKLDFQASMYNEHYVYWKDDGKFWKDTASVNYPQLWRYNCVDCVATFEIIEAHEKALKVYNLEAQSEFQNRRLFQPVMKMMMRGVKLNLDKKKQLKKELEDFLSQLRLEVNHLAGFDLNVNSPKQMINFFYTRLKLPVQRKKGLKDGDVTLVPTCDDEALKKLAKIEPCIGPLIQRINMVRSYETAYDACKAPVDSDGRWRTSYIIPGTETLRFTSSENPFGSGLNLQNLTIGKDIT